MDGEREVAIRFGCFPEEIIYHTRECHQSTSNHRTLTLAELRERYPGRPLRECLACQAAVVNREQDKSHYKALLEAAKQGD